MEWVVQRDVKEEKIYNLFRCGYLDVRKWLEETDIVLIPLGSTEQHGRHLPVSTDSIATELPCQLAAELANVPHYQTIPFGYSPQHLHEPGVASGTVTLSASVYQNLLYEVGRSLIQNGFNKLIFATGHTSNMKAVDPALRTLRYETGAFVCCWRNDAEAAPALLADEGIIENPPEEAPGWHGSEVETSECMYFESMYGKKIVHLERTDKDFTHAPKWITRSTATPVWSATREIPSERHRKKASASCRRRPSCSLSSSKRSRRSTSRSGIAITGIARSAPCSHGAHHSSPPNEWPRTLSAATRDEVMHPLRALG
jgi:creatinine amidohydrolase/Fe(II)-dependent formamide hydrolase-like protein